MKFVKVERGGRTGQGILQRTEVRIVGDWSALPADQTGFTLPTLPIDSLKAQLDQGGETLPLGSVTLAIPIDPRRRIICVGVNYRDHANEIKTDEPENPLIFTRTFESLVAHGQPIVRPRVSETFDYEGEIAVIIGREARHVTEANALDYVAGYSCFMDGSVRQYQRHSLTAGKNFWRSGSMGPWIVSADAFAADDPALETRLNGEVVQSARASEMIFGIRQIIAYCSRWMPLLPGDVIATGTPGGVGSRRTPPKWMKAGDRIEVDVEGIGVLANPVIDEA